MDLDLSDAVALRRWFFTDTDRRQTIAASVLDSRRFGDIPPAVAARLLAAHRLMFPLVSRLVPSARAYRLNLFDIHPTDEE